MLTAKDIQNLTKYQLEVFKDVFASKEDIVRIEKTLNTMQTTLDAVSKNTEVTTQDNLILNHRMKNVENWIDEASPKVGVKFQH